MEKIYTLLMNTKYIFNQFNKSKGVSFANNNTYIDGKISSSALNEDFFNKINILAPYGAGNSEPIFLIENIKVVKAIPVGKNHLRVIFISKNNVTKFDLILLYSNCHVIFF